MTDKKRKTSELTVNSSPSTSTTVVGVDNGETVQIPITEFVTKDENENIGEVVAKEIKISNRGASYSSNRLSQNDDGKLVVTGNVGIQLTAGHGGDILMNDGDATIHIQGGEAVEIKSYYGGDDTKIRVYGGEDRGEISITAQNNISMHSEGNLHIGIGDSYGSGINFYDDDSGIEIDTNNLVLGKVSQILASTSKGSSYVSPGEAGQVLTSNGVGAIYWGNASGGGSPMTSVTYAELKALRDGRNLIPGMFYKITDYECTTTQEGTRAMSHNFYIIVQALSCDTLSEIAKADINTSGNDEYFVDAGANLSAWEIKYCLDNDTTRFAWADEENGKGVIYYMKDEHGNECPYDFKNIQFKRMINPDDGYPVHDEERGMETWVYTFCGRPQDENTEEWGLFVDGSTEGYWGVPNTNDMYSFHSNVIKEQRYDDNLCETARLRLNDIVFLGIWANNNDGVSWSDCCHNNVVEEDCFNITLGPGCCWNHFHKWTSYISLGGWSCFNDLSSANNIKCFGDLCESVFESGCSEIYIEDGCNNITFDKSCWQIEVRQYSTNLKFGQGCNGIVINPDCSFITFGRECSDMNIRDTCTNLTFGDQCSESDITPSSQNFTFGNRCQCNYFNEQGGNMSNITLGDDCCDNSFDSNTHIYLGNNCCGNAFGYQVSRIQLYPFIRDSDFNESGLPNGIAIYECPGIEHRQI